MMNRSFRWRVIFAFAALLILSMGALNIFLSNYLYKTYISNFSENLTNEAHLLADQVRDWVTSGDNTQLEELANQYDTSLDRRVTIIDTTGKVLAESSKDPALLENHLSRPEIQKALTGINDHTIRFSDTLKVNLLYAAVPIYKDAQIIGVARLANSISAIEENIRILRLTILGATILTTLLAILLAIAVTDYTIKPLHELTENVGRLGKDATLEIAYSNRLDEVGNLSRAFSQMSSQINHQFEQLKTEQGKLSTVLANMNDGILIISDNGSIELSNPAARELFKVEAEDIMGASFVEIVRNHQIVELWQTAKNTGQQQSSMVELSPNRKFLQVISNPLTNTLPGYTLMVIQDLTRLRKLEVVRRDFVSNVSHELRTPLASLKLLTETLQEGALEDLPAARKFLIQMENEIDNLTQLVRELLELSRIESGRVPLERKAIAPCDVVSPAVERMEIQANRAGLQVKFECPTDMPDIYADPDRVEQVLVNLLHNAIKFTPPGGMITVSAYHDPGRVVFRVSDSGVGIAQADLERIFERFYKSDRARSSGGTGLGLSIARHIIESPGGKIWAESTPGSGSIFFFSIPTIQNNSFRD